MPYANADEVLRLALMMQGTREGVSKWDVQRSFSCSPRKAERLIAKVLDLFPQAEEVGTGEKYKAWHLPSRTLTGLISFGIDELTAVQTAAKLAARENLAAQARYLDDVALKVQALLRPEIQNRFSADLFSLRKFAERSFGVFQEEPFDVGWRFKPEAAEDAREYQFHPTQAMEEQPDGSLIVRTPVNTGGSMRRPEQERRGPVEALACPFVTRAHAGKLSLVADRPLLSSLTRAHAGKLALVADGHLVSPFTRAYAGKHSNQLPGIVPYISGESRNIFKTPLAVNRRIRGSAASSQMAVSLECTERQAEYFVAYYG